MGNLGSLSLEGEMVIFHRLCVLEAYGKACGGAGAKWQVRKPLLTQKEQRCVKHPRRLYDFIMVLCASLSLFLICYVRPENLLSPKERRTGVLHKTFLFWNSLDTYLAGLPKFLLQDSGNPGLNKGSVLTDLNKPETQCFHSKYIGNNLLTLL